MPYLLTYVKNTVRCSGSYDSELLAQRAARRAKANGAVNVCIVYEMPQPA